MKISFINDLPAQYINLSTYLGEQNPLVVPVGSSNVPFLTSITNSLNTQYGSTIALNIDSTDTTSSTFDQSYLFPIKKAQSTLKGGLFFLPSTVSGGNTLYPFYSLVVTRSPTSYFFLPCLAAQSIINSQFTKSITITVANHPLPLTYNQIMVNNTISGFLGAFIFTLALAFKYASIVAFIVKEREDRVKHQQIVSGMKLSAYWFANFIYDYLLYLVVAVPAAGLCIAMNISALVTGNAETATWLLFVAYGLAYVPFTYIAAFAYREYGSAQSYYFFLTFLIGGMLPVLTLVLRIISSGSSRIGRYIAWALRAFPAFAFGEGIINLGSITMFSQTENDGNPIDPFSLEITLAPIFYLFG
jgi:ATP-binding cassette, subfamily A (ABC1), member 3